MRNIDWNNVNEAGSMPTPGGYAAKITRVDDVEDKEYLMIYWDFADGPYKGANAETYDRAGFWPTRLVKSYKQSALPFFKAFKTAVENSNAGYTFRNDPQSLVGKFVGVVLGEEEYQKGDGSIGKRLYVAQVRSGDKIRTGDYTVPELKKLAPTAAQTAAPAFAPITEEDAQLPF